MNISSKMLNIPPYISVAWKDVSSLHSKMDALGQPVLVITLKTFTQAEVPHLSPAALDEIFQEFVRHQNQEKLAENQALEGPFHFSVPIKQGLPVAPMTHTGTAHNPQQANLPDLPPEVLEKITQIAKIFGLEDSSLLPSPEEHCNCVHCQIVRSMHGETPIKEHTLVEEEISNEELTFRNWDIAQTSEKLYTVTSPLDAHEHYTVFLGDPLGCTCGEKNCEHIRAVLST